jgi:2-keto-3-deoxy-L-rhamnonate aldolase RhmA
MASFINRSAQLSRNLKAKLAAGQVATMINANHPSANLAEKLGEFGFDAVLIDCEHGTAGPEKVEDMARGAHIGGLVSIVRPETGLEWVVRRYIECVVDGWMVPLVHNAAAAQAIVDAVRFGCALDHDDRFLIVMIESVEAVNNLDEILDVQGIDVFLVAPADIAKNIGALTTLRDWEEGKRSDELRTILDRAIKTIVDRGKTCGTLVSRTDVQSYIDKGVRLLYTHTNHMIASGSKEFLGCIKGAQSVGAQASRSNSPQECR